MFSLIAGAGSVAAQDLLERIGGALRGGYGAARLWRDPERSAGAASLGSDILPEDAFDRQPLVERGRVFVCQARLDNREELIETLGLARDAQLADSAVLAAAYDRWGQSCVDRLVGDFAFAAWHREDGRVVAAVDPMGMRRLLWTRLDSGIMLSSQLPAVLAHPGVSREPDLAAIARLLDSGIDRTTTAFAAVRALPGGHLLVWRGGKPQIRRWWNPAFEPTVWHRDPRDYVDETRQLLTEAVRAQLRSSAPLSSMLSGGLDSGCVTAAAADMLAARGEGLSAYTAVPAEGLTRSQRAGWEADDSGYAAEVARRFENVKHHLVPPAGRCALHPLQRVANRSMTPSKTATNLLWIDAVADSAAACGSRVLLTGQRGNFGFSWRGQNTIWELAMRGKTAQAAGQARREARARQKSLAWVLAGAVRGGIRSWSRLGLGSTISNPELSLLRPAYRGSAQTRGNEYALAPGTRRFWAAVATTPAHVFWPEPMRQWGVEFRDPTGDRRLIERLLQYPQAAFRIGGRYRGLARAVGEGLLPERVRLRSSQGAQVPEAPALIAAHAAEYRTALNAMRQSHQCRELFQLDAVEKALERSCAGFQNYRAALTLDRVFSVGLFLVSLEDRHDR